MARPVTKEKVKRAGVPRDSKGIVILVANQATAPDGAKPAREAEVAK